MHAYIHATALHRQAAGIINHHSILLPLVVCSPVSFTRPVFLVGPLPDKPRPSA
ncbi:hypothetical protein FIBSPDRAFT_878712 [Athelia psychrophila]|uniref:Uncharacterized protein n=1 Tax=Athelia psychrophila TaxID=1759441 RepID=A0A167US49_9AGAM|nr:hypothetical protein FIBSPDRAFT_878712 [Fibularhizoctonia sp. CBS 109695]